MRNVVYLLCILVSVFATSPTYSQTPPYVRTLVVGSGGSPTTNGSNLLSAIASITTASASNPWLVKVEPGIFDLGASTLTMKSYVDVEGSGRNSTVITSTASWTVLANTGTSAELRDLTVKNTSSGMASGIYMVSSDFRLSRVNVDVDTGDQGVAMEVVNSSPSLTDISVKIKTGRWGATGLAMWSSNSRVEQLTVKISSSNSDAIGVSIGGSSYPNLDRLVVDLQSSLTAFGVVFQGGSPVVSNCQVRVSGGTTLNTGLFSKNTGTAHVRDCFVNVQGVEARGVDAQSPAVLEVRSSTIWAVSTGRAWGLFNEGAQISVSNSEVRGVGTTQGIGAFSINGTSVSQIESSSVEGSTYGASNWTSGDRIYLSTSKLIGSVQATTAGGYTCVGSYSGTYVPLNASCL
jgi:hypothetical protein